MKCDICGNPIEKSSHPKKGVNQCHSCYMGIAEANEANFRMGKEKKIYCTAVKCNRINVCKRIGNDGLGSALYACPKCNSIFTVCDTCGEKRMLMLPLNEEG